MTEELTTPEMAKDNAELVRPRAKKQLDELDVMRKIADLLDPLDEFAKQRVMKWAVDKVCDGGFRPQAVTYEHA